MRGAIPDADIFPRRLKANKVDSRPGVDNVSCASLVDDLTNHHKLSIICDGTSTPSRTPGRENQCLSAVYTPPFSIFLGAHRDGFRDAFSTRNRERVPPLRGVGKSYWTGKYDHTRFQARWCALENYLWNWRPLQENVQTGWAETAIRQDDFAGTIGLVLPPLYGLKKLRFPILKIKGCGEKRKC